MRDLLLQSEFEELLGLGEMNAVNPVSPVSPVTIVYFTAKWCGACRALDIPALEAAVPVNWLKCDIDQNEYTAGYCGVRAIPSFLIVIGKKVAGTIQSNSNEKVLAWIKSFL